MDQAIVSMDNRENGVVSGLNDRIVFKINERTITISIGNLFISSFSQLVEAIERKLESHPISVVYNKSLARNEKWNTINGIIFYTEEDQPFSIRQCTLRTFLTLTDQVITSTKHSTKDKHFITSYAPVRDDNELADYLSDLRTSRMTNLCDKTRSVCILMGMGREILAQHTQQETQ